MVKSKTTQKILSHLIVLTIFWSPLAAFSQAAPKLDKNSFYDPKENKEVYEYTVTDPNTKKKYTITYPYTSKKELKKVSPSSLDKKFQAQMNQMYPGGAFKSTMRRFPSEALIFYAAMGATMVQDSFFDPHVKGGRLNPNWLDTLAHEVTSPVGIASFAGFMVASSGTSKGMMHIAHALEKRSLRKLNKEQLSTQSKQVRKKVRKDMLKLSQKGSGAANVVRTLTGPHAMAAGMMVSNVMHEFVYHEDVILCKNSLRYPKDSKIDPEACNRAFNYWVLSPNRRIYDWLPDIVAMLSASTLAHTIVNTTKKALSSGVAQATKKQAQRIIFKSALIPIAAKSLGFLASAKIQIAFMTFSNLYVFMNVHSKVTDPIIARPWKTWRNSTDLMKGFINVQKDLAELERKKFKINKPTPMACIIADKKREQLNKIHPSLVTHTETQEDIKLFSKMCKEHTEAPHKSIALLQEYAKKQSAWRNFNLETSWMAFTGWQDSMYQLLESYESTYNFYYDLFQKHTWFQGAKSVDNPYRKIQPYNSIKGTVPETSINNAISYIDQYLLKNSDFKKSPEAYTNIVKVNPISSKENIKVDLSYHQSRLLEIRHLLSAINQENPLKFFYTNKELTNTKSPEKDLRTEAVVKGIYLINQMINEQRRYGPRGHFAHDLDLEQIPEQYRDDYALLRKDNVFLKVRSILGTPLPQAAGMEYLNELENREGFFLPEFKSQHAKRIQRMVTKRTVDYMLTSMVCGPSAEETEVQLSTEALQAMEKIKKLERNPDELNAESTKQLGQLIGTVNSHTEFDSPLIKNPLIGISYEFLPPRIVKNAPRNFCNKIFTVLDAQGHRDPYRSQQLTNFNPHQILIRENGKEYRGILSYINENLDKDLIGSKDGQLYFNRWWESQIAPVFYKLVGDLRKEYRKLMTEQFSPAFKSNELETYQISLNNKNFEAWKKLGTQWQVSDQFIPLLRKKTIEYSDIPYQMNHVSQKEIKELTLPKGVMGSLRQEIPIWLNILQRMSQSDKYKAFVSKDTLLAQGRIFVKSIEEMEQSLSFSTEQGEGFVAAYENSQKALEEISTLYMMDLQKLQQMSPKEKIESRNQTLEQQIVMQSLLALSNLNQELVSYRSILQLIPDE